MDVLVKTIKRLSEEDYDSLLREVSSNKLSKPYIVLETARKQEFYSDSQMMELLQVNPSTYYTLKSRLNTKVASILSKKVDNPISVLLDEVTRVPAMLYSENKQVAVRALKELEKQLLEYDLSNELIIVYKTLARLHMYSPDYDYYDKQYNKYVAFSLASVKAENLFYSFIQKAGFYQLGRKDEDLEAIQGIIREFSNILELYESHRLFVLFNIVRIYYLCMVTDQAEALQNKELEIDKTLQEIRNIFNKYPLDTMYANIRFLVDFLYFEYYQKIKYNVRAEHYYQLINDQVPEIARQQVMAFHVVQFLKSKIDLYLKKGDINMLTDLEPRLEESFDVDKNEIFHYVTYQQYLAVNRFYTGDYAGAARIINNLRYDLNLKQYWTADIDCKLFQSLQYCLLGEEELMIQITNSISRNIREEKGQYKNIKVFIKLLKARFKETDPQKKAKKIQSLWADFQAKNEGTDSILPYLKLNETIITRMAGSKKA